MKWLKTVLHRRGDFSRHKKTLALSTLTLIAALATTTANAQFTLRVQGQPQATISSSEPIRLSAALEQLKAPSETYWLAATFGQISEQNQIEKKKFIVLNQLRQLKTLWADEPEKVQALNALSNLLKAKKFVSKSFYQVDLDQVRLNLKKDPVLNQDLIFYFPKRSTEVQLIGALEKTITLPHQPGKTISAYVAQASTLGAARNDWVYVIQPDGMVEQAPIGYWLKPSTRIAPGATLYLAIAELPDPHLKLNEQIADLLRYQTSWWEK